MLEPSGSSGRGLERPVAGGGLQLGARVRLPLGARLGGGHRGGRGSVVSVRVRQSDIPPQSETGS
jgi:hypothetical protein